MNAEEVRRRFPDFDTSDVDRWIGVPLGGGQLKDPVAANDVRRWVRLHVRERVSDDRGKVFPGYRFDGDYEEDIQLQQALAKMFEKLGARIEDVPEYARIPTELAEAAKRREEAEKAKKG